MAGMHAITLLVLTLPYPASSSPTLVVNTTGGTVEGYVSGSVRYFDGVPYAAPPNGSLRWRPPQPVTPWPGVRQAKQLPSFCPQSLPWPIVSPVDEDCLYLNIVTPAELPAKPMPVQFWVHGGGMKEGGSRQPLYRGSDVVEFTTAAMDEPVVIVTFNYRLDMFAMLVQHDLITEQKGGPLNYGLQDQCFAMQWVQDNIAAFGGDPKRVMMYGESGGGQSVTLQLFADSKVTGCGNFAAAVGESVVNAYVVQQSPAHVAKNPGNPFIGDMPTNLANGDKFTKNLGCAGKGVDCLRSATVAQVHSASTGIDFNVVVDGMLLPDWPGKLLRNGSFYHVPVIMGSATNEGQLFAPGNPRSVQALAKNIKSLYFPWLSDSIITRIANYYAGRYGGKTYELAYQEFVNDVVTKCTNLAVANAYAAAGVPSFIYEFGYSYNDGEKHKSGIASHGAELSFVWGNTYSAIDLRPKPSPPKFTAKEQRLADQTMAYWASFAATHNPNAASPPPGSAHWPAVASGAAAFNSSMGLNISDKLGILPTTLDGCALLGEVGLFPIPTPTRSWTEFAI